MTITKEQGGSLQFWLNGDDTIMTITKEQGGSLQFWLNGDDKRLFFGKEKRGRRRIKLHATTSLGWNLPLNEPPSDLLHHNGRSSGGVVNNGHFINMVCDLFETAVDSSTNNFYLFFFW